MKYFGSSNLLYARATHAITNYTPISKYQLRFFLRENFAYLCGIYSIETLSHSLNTIQMLFHLVKALYR